MPENTFTFEELCLLLAAARTAGCVSREHGHNNQADKYADLGDKLQAMVNDHPDNRG